MKVKKVRARETLKKRIYKDVDTLELKGNERDDLTIEDAY